LKTMAGQPDFANALPAITDAATKAIKTLDSSGQNTVIAAIILAIIAVIAILQKLNKPLNQ